MKRKGATVKLRYTHWEGNLPERGDWLRTTTGRQYEIVEVRGNQLICIVLQNDAQPTFGTTIFNWIWTKRKRRK